MIDRLWTERAPVADWFVDARPSGTAAATIARAGVSARQGLRATAKTIYRFARRQKP